MAGLRRSLGRWATVCLLLQAAALLALLPRDCCRAHAHQRQESRPSCHTAAEKTEPQCALRGTCNGPMSAMTAQLSQVGVLPVETNLPLDGLRATRVHIAPEVSRSRLIPPDSPPPRG